MVLVLGWLGPSQDIDVKQIIVSLIRVMKENFSVPSGFTWCVREGLSGSSIWTQSSEMSKN